MMTITNGMADIVNFIKRDVVYAEYKSGSTWTRIALHDIRLIYWIYPFTWALSSAVYLVSLRKQRVFGRGSMGVPEAAEE